MEPANLRREYSFAGLRRKDLHQDPVQQFRNWFNQALGAEVIEPNAMTLKEAEGKTRAELEKKGLAGQLDEYYTSQPGKLPTPLRRGCVFHSMVLERLLMLLAHLRHDRRACFIR